jgi:hypothetical protein
MKPIDDATRRRRLSDRDVNFLRKFISNLPAVPRAEIMSPC